MRPLLHARLAGAAIKSLVYHRLFQRPRPFGVQFAVTHRCNLACSYCRFPQWKSPDLSLDDVEKLFSRFRKMGVRRLGIVGGEPLVRRDLGEVLEMAARFRFLVHLNTNLLLYHRRPELFSRVDGVITSLDGNRDAHEKNRGPGSFDGVLDSIRSVVERRIPVVAICVATENNLDQADWLLSQARKLGFLMHFQPGLRHPSHPIAAPTAELPPNEEYRRFFADLLGKKRGGAGIITSESALATLAGWPDFATHSVWKGKTRCAAGYATLFVNASGEAWPCPALAGRFPAVPLLHQSWGEGFAQPAPCNECIVCGAREYNSLFSHPVKSAGDLLALALKARTGRP